MRWAAVAILCAFAVAVILGVLVVRPGRGAGVEDKRGLPQVEILLTEEGFFPQKVRITAGTEVIFSTNRTSSFWPASNAHPAHQIYPDFDPKKPVDAGMTWSFIAKKGTWGYHDHIRSYYTGTLYVE